MTRLDAVRWAGRVVRAAAAEATARWISEACAAGRSLEEVNAEIVASEPRSKAAIIRTIGQVADLVLAAATREEAEFAARERLAAAHGRLLSRPHPPC